MGTASRRMTIGAPHRVVDDERHRASTPAMNALEVRDLIGNRLNEPLHGTPGSRPEATPCGRARPALGLRLDSKPTCSRRRARKGKSVENPSDSTAPPHSSRRCRTRPRRPRSRSARAMLICGKTCPSKGHDGEEEPRAHCRAARDGRPDGQVVAERAGRDEVVDEVDEEVHRQQAPGRRSASSAAP